MSIRCPSCARMDKPEAYPTRNEQDAARGCGVAANAGLWRKNPGDYTAKEHGAEAEDGSDGGGLPVRRYGHCRGGRRLAALA